MDVQAAASSALASTAALQATLRAETAGESVLRWKSRAPKLRATGTTGGRFMSQMPCTALRGM